MPGSGLSPDTVSGWLKTFILLAAAVLVFQAIISPALGTGYQRSVDEQVLLYPDGSGDLSADSEIENFSATQTLGTAVEFTGASDSELSGQAEIDVAGNWTVTTWAERDPTASGTRRVLQLDSWLYISHNNTSGWRVTYYDAATTAVYTVTAPAPNATSWTFLEVRRNATALSLARNNTTVAAEPIDGTGNGEIVAADHWDGRQEETRIINETLSDAQRGALYATPTAPLEVDEVARIYYDAYDDESSVDVYRTGSDLQLRNASVVDGFKGEPLVEDDLLDLQVDDYQRDGTTISTTSDGNLTGAPVVFVSYDGFFNDYTSPSVPGSEAMIVLVVIAVAVVVTEQVINL